VSGRVLAGIAVVLFAGRVLPRAEALAHCELPPRLPRAWLAAVCWVAPVAMAVFLATLVLG
jgi:hypothetical protein